MNKNLFRYGGYIAGVVLIAFGVVAIAMGWGGRGTVSDSLKAEGIVGSADMTPALIAKAVSDAGLKNVAIPSCSVAGLDVNSGDRARCFAQYMRIHTLEASGGMPYAQMPRFASADGKGTNDAAAATKTAAGGPMSNPARDLWVTETALATALNTSYMADQLALFAMVIGVGFVLAGVGFLVISGGLLARATKETVKAPEVSTTTVTA
jgi:hypothetical protein